MTEAEFDTILALSHEVPGVEFKASGDRGDKSFFSKIVKAILGMSNRRDGGVVVIGVQQVSGQMKAAGVDAGLLATWNHDDVSSGVAAYADPGVTIAVSVLVRDEASFVVIEVAEFERVPVLCDKAYDEPGGKQILKKGALYVRPKGIPSTTEIASHAELRDLLDLAIEKGVRDFLATAARAGIDIEELRQRGDQALFDAQRSGWDD
jgi:predicted HTH transcriptional regulator